MRYRRCYDSSPDDNPSIDAGVEDIVLKNELYERIMKVILRRIEQHKEKGYQM